MKTRSPLFRIDRFLFAFAAAALFAAMPEAKAQYQITSLNTTITENFNGMTFSSGIGFSGSLNDNTNTTAAQRNAAWSFINGNSQRSGGNASFNSINQRSGVASAGGFYSAGNNATTTDRSLAMLGVGSTLGANTAGATATFQNTSGGSITSFVLSYTGEQWVSQAARTSSITVSYSLDGSTYTTISGLTFNALSTVNLNATGGTGGTTGAAWVNGDSNDYRTVFSGVTVNLASNVANGSNILIRWFYDGGGGSGSRQMLGIDDVSVTFNGAAATPGNYWAPTSSGGAGTWSSGNNNWATAPAVAGTGPQATTGNLIFGGTGGQVSVSGTVSAVAGLTFSANAYVLTNGTVNLTGGDAAANTITTDASVGTTIYSVLGGTTGMTKAGSGTLTLLGANTYTGGTLVSAGELSGNATSLLGDITNNATLVFNQSGTGTYGGAITGTGTLVKDNTGTLILAGANAQATGGTLIFGGTLQIGNGGTTGSLSGTIDNDGTLVFNRSDNITQSSAISGSGALIKQGAGTLTLSGTYTYTGTTTVTNGTLSVSGNIASSAVSVGHASSAGGSVLMGSGAVGATTINTNGVISPGNSVGSLSVSNTLTWNGGGSYLWEINGTNGPAGTTWDLITVDTAVAGDGLGTLNLPGSGQFTINGTAIDAFAFDGDQDYLGNYFLIVEAATISGSLGNLAFIPSGLGLGTWSFSTNATGLYLNYEAPAGVITFTPTGVVTQSESAVTPAGSYGTITGGFTVVIDGTGTLVMTNGANDYTGVTSVLGGTLRANVNAPNGAAGAFGNAVTAIAVGDTSGSDNAALDIGVDGVTIGRAVEVVSGSSGTKTLGTSLTSGTATYSGAVVLGTGAQLTSGGTANAVFSGEISGTAGITKVGDGTVTLSGSTANSFGGAATVSAGTLLLNKSGVEAITTSATVNGGTLLLGAAHQIANTATVTLGGGTFDLGNNNETITTLQLNSGTVSGTGILTATTYNLAGGTVNGVLAGGTLNASANAALNGTAAATTLNITGGTLTLGSAGRLTGTTPTLNLSGGGALALGGDESVGALNLTNGTVSGSGTLTVGSTIDAQQGTLSANLAGSSGLTKTTASTVILSGNNSSLSGTMTLTAGTLALGSANALGTGALALNGGTLSADGATPRTITNSTTFGGNVGLGSASSGNLTFSGPVSFGSAQRTLTVGSGVGATFSGTYGTGGVTKAGAGSLVFASSGSITSLSNTAGNVTINEGVTLTTTAGALSVASGASLNINGTWLNSSTTAWLNPTGSVVVGASGVVVQQGNAGSTALLITNANTTWTAGSTMIYRDFTGAPLLSGRTYQPNLVFESTGANITNSVPSGANAWTVMGNLTIGANYNFNFGTFTGATDYQNNITIGGTFGAVNGARSFTLQSGKELLLQNTGALNMAAGQTATINGGVRTTASAAQQSTISGGTVSLGDGTRTFDVAAGTGNAGLAISSVVSSGALTKTGGGRLTLSGASANTYTGMTTVSAGTLELNKSLNTAAIAGNITVGNGTTDSSVRLLLSASGQVANTSEVTLSGGTIMRGSGVSEVFGNLNLTAASFLDFGTGDIGTLSFGTYTSSALLTVQNFLPGNKLQFATGFDANLLPTGGNLSNANFSFSNGFTTGTEGGYFTITAIPEPSTYLAAAGLLSLMLWPSRKRLIKDAKKILGLRAPMRDRLAARRA